MGDVGVVDGTPDAWLLALPAPPRRGVVMPAGRGVCAFIGGLARGTLSRPEGCRGGVED